MTCSYDGPKTGLTWLSHMGRCDEHRMEGWANHDNRVPYVGTVPGGFNDSKGDARYDFQKGFDSGLAAYEKARTVDGIQPESTTVEGVEQAYAKVRSQQKALKKMKKFADPADIKVAPGVEK